MLLTTAVNERMAEREQAQQAEEFRRAKQKLRAKLQASSLPGGAGDPIQVFGRHDREQQGGLTLEQFSNALRREPFKLDRASMSDEQVAALFASLDTAKSGVVALPKLGSLAGSATRKPLGAIEGNGTPTPRDRQARGKPAGAKHVRGPGRARLAKLHKLQVVAPAPAPGGSGADSDADAIAMLVAAEATVIAREQGVTVQRSSSDGGDSIPATAERAASLLPSRKGMSCIPRKALRPTGGPSKAAESCPVDVRVAPSDVPSDVSAEDTPPVTPVDESPTKSSEASVAASEAGEGTEHDSAESEPAPSWSAEQHEQFLQALEQQGGMQHSPEQAWGAISAQVGVSVAEVKEHGMRYLEELSQAPAAEEEEVPSAQPSPAPAVPAQETTATAAAPVPARTADAPTHGWSKAERQRLAAALDALGPALLSRANLQPQEAAATWSALAAAVGGGRTAWETRLFAAEWLLRGGGAAPRATAAAPSSTGSQDQSALIEELVAEHAECEAERREAVRQWTETEALVTEIVAEHAGVEAERREALRRAEIAEEELSESNRMARVVAIDVIARNLAASAIQAQWRDFCSRRAFAEARRRWNMAVDTRAAAQLARVVMSAEATQQSLSSGPTPLPICNCAENPLRLGDFPPGLDAASSELVQLRKGVVNATARLRAEQEQHRLSASTRAPSV